MRELLARWAAVEPGRCKHTATKNLITRDKDLEEIHLIDSAGRWRMVLSDALGLDLEEDDFMRIEWATQAAIIARGWAFTLTYDNESNLKYSAKVCIDKDNCINLGSEDGLTEALLATYLRTLEKTR